MTAKTEGVPRLDSGPDLTSSWASVTADRFRPTAKATVSLSNKSPRRDRRFVGYKHATAYWTPSRNHREHRKRPRSRDQPEAGSSHRHRLRESNLARVSSRSTWRQHPARVLIVTISPA